MGSDVALAGFCFYPTAGKLLKDPTRGILSGRSTSWRGTVEVAVRRLGRAARDPQDVALRLDHQLKEGKRTYLSNRSRSEAGKTPIET
jgi:hypothetical protein